MMSSMKSAFTGTARLKISAASGSTSVDVKVE
jgi:hypothetical protein